MSFQNRCAAAALISALAFVGAGCSSPAGQGAIFVTVELEPGLVATCVKVSATDDTLTLETDPMPLAGKSQLRVGIAPAGLASTVRLKATGYLDAMCQTPSGEESAEAEKTFATPPASATLVLGPVSRNDGGSNPDGGSDAGMDAGTDAGVDAGVDAGIDNDLDMVPLPADCNDNDNTVYPGATELCGDGKDNDCANGADCADTSGVCNGMSCGTGNLCVSGMCMGPNENCVDGMDNNGNSLVDCLDPQCTPGTACNDRDLCTNGETCVADGGCGAPTMVTTCTPSEPQCQMGGVCQPDSGVCTFTNVSGACNDTLACTAVGACMNGACVPGMTTTCGPPQVCRSAGACVEPGGTCEFPPAAAGSGVGSCSDNDNCTINDACDGDGGCAGTRAPPCAEPTQCHALVPNVCETDGGCTFTPRGTCDAGAGLGAATCDSMFNCNLTPTSLFPYTPSNFTEAQLPADGGVALRVDAGATLNSDTPSYSGPGGMPPFTVITPPGGSPTLLVRVSSLTVDNMAVLNITGARPVIFAVTGDITINGGIRARNSDPALAACGDGAPGDATTIGGGGGGFGSAGGKGGGATAVAGDGGIANGVPSLEPLRGGCSGGTASTTVGGAGGGAIQLSAAGTLTVNGVVTAPGRGGAGNSANDNNGGGGGGSGGGLLLEGAIISVTAAARLTANGGGGGAGSDNQNAGPGSDGAELTATPAPGGPDVAGTNGGGAGAAGAIAAGNGIQRMTNDGSGGGGGGVGRIRLNARNMCTITTGRVISPAHTSGGMTNCP